MGPFEAWRTVVAAMGEVTRAFGEFERTMNWQPQSAMPERRGPGRPRKEAQPAARGPAPPEERIVTSVAELMVADPEPEPEPEPAPPKRPRTRRRAANGATA